MSNLIMQLKENYSIFSEKTFYMDLNIGKLLRKIEAVRIEKKFSQSKMGESIGVRRQQYWNLLTEKSEISLVQLQQLCKTLDISLLKLISDSSITEYSKEEIKEFLDKMIEFATNLKTDIENENTD